MNDPFSILVAGVGGQGNLVCGRVIAEATVLQGLRPVVGDTFGASRRGGSVVTHIRIGTQDWGPLIPRGEVDILLGLEPLEALRAAVRYAGNRTIAIVNKTPMPPSNVLSGEQRYPAIENIEGGLASICKGVHMLDADPVFKEIGSTKVLNSFMLGALSALEDTPLDPKNLKLALSNIMDSDIDLTAFDEGKTSLL